ncbi:MAG TPA: hypothetical protein VK838_04430, partial [Candidatus Limnocylindrales bacterium]|nr:hypothetical protein [Candidatus Limnocylindrales bacterium]
GRYRLAIGLPDGVRTADADDDLLLALAIAYFEDAMDDPPPDIEATHADLSDLVRSVAAGSRTAERRRLLDEAVDAIDDGLAVDALVNRLNAAIGPQSEEQADPVDLLLERVEALRAEP